jgi:replicative DNA helicase
MARTADDVRPARTERVPPHNIEAEESVLGAMMLSSEAIATVVEVMKPDDFYRLSHQRMYQVMIDLYARGEPVDAVTVVEALMRQGTIQEVGGPLYVHNLVESVPTPASAGYYARIVADHALLRRLIEAASRIMADAYGIPGDPRKAADQAEALIYQVARQDERNRSSRCAFSSTRPSTPSSTSSSGAARSRASRRDFAIWTNCCRACRPATSSSWPPARALASPRS